MPVPERVTCCGLVVALSRIVSDASCVPTVLGTNEIPSLHELSGATVTAIAPQVPVPLSAYSESDDVTLETISGRVAPVFLIVMGLVAAWPTATLPNDRDDVADIEVVGVAVGVAVAVVVAVCVAVAVAVRVAVAVADAVGVAVCVAVEVEVAVAVEVAVGVAVAVAVGVAVCVAVAVAVDVAVAVRVAVAVADAVAVGVAV